MIFLVVFLCVHPIGCSFIKGNLPHATLELCHVESQRVFKYFNNQPSYRLHEFSYKCGDGKFIQVPTGKDA